MHLFFCCPTNTKNVMQAYQCARQVVQHGVKMCKKVAQPGMSEIADVEFVDNLMRFVHCFVFSEECSLLTSSNRI